jgi:glycosyltransferase involved in cell wall biosynthesis
MRALPTIVKSRPHARVLIVGEESNGYGAKHPSGKTWKQILVDEVRHEFTKEEWSRVHFLGQIPYSQFVSLLQISTVHDYLTYRFVLSWSLLEAMSVGCAIVASDTQPLHEAIIDTETGLFVDFFDHTKLSNTVVSLMNDKELRNRLGANARRNAIANFDLNTKCLPIQIEWATNKVLS